MATTPPLRMQDLEDADLPIAYALLREAALVAGDALSIDFAASPIRVTVRSSTGELLSDVTVRGKLSAALRASAAAIRAARAA